MTYGDITGIATSIGGGVSAVMDNPTEPLTTRKFGGSNSNSPIFGRKHMVDYFYDWSEPEENEYSGTPRLDLAIFVLLL